MSEPIWTNIFYLPKKDSKIKKALKEYSDTVEPLSPEENAAIDALFESD